MIYLFSNIASQKELEEPKMTPIKIQYKDNESLQSSVSVWMKTSLKLRLHIFSRNVSNSVRRIFFPDIIHVDLKSGPEIAICKQIL
jgi:hypothetical protein